ncbi:MAG: ribosome maturation factor RimM, partial [Deltaproteobacteria bacterium]|nr:ribosome maturation factor RimM [Deltaproteobacteria bacterium]
MPRPKKDKSPSGPTPPSPLAPSQSSQEKALDSPINETQNISPPPSQVLLGRLGKAHGIKGEIYMEFYGLDPSILKKASFILLNPRTHNQRQAVVSAYRPHQKGLIVSFPEITTRTQAEALTGYELLIPREVLPEIEDDEVYIHDLMGLRVLDPGG